MTKTLPRPRSHLQVKSLEDRVVPSATESLTLTRWDSPSPRWRMLYADFCRFLRALWFRPRAGRTQRHPLRPSLRPVVECLEGRSVPATLTLTIPATSMSEAAGPNAVSALLNRTGDLSQPLTVSLTSSDTTEATVPPTVSFAVGQQEVSFPINAVDDAILDGTQSVTITTTGNVTQGQPFGFDLSYGTNGVAPTQLTMNIQPPTAAIAIQLDGKAIVASESPFGTNGWRVQRFNTDGTVDSSFGGGLVTTTDLGGGLPVPFKAVVLPDGDILIGGKVAQGTGAGILVRYNPDGTLDTDFGVGGKANLAPLNNGVASAWVTDFALRPDGRILLGLGVNGSVTTRVAQLNANGTFDATFGASGISNLNLGYSAEQVEILGDGTFLVGGSFTGPMRVARVQANGVGLVTSFGTAGTAALDFGRQFSQVAGMEVDLLGRIVIGGSVSDSGSPPSDYAVGRLNPNGTPDTLFAGDGTAVIDAGGQEVAAALVLQQDGKVIVGGFTTPVPSGDRDSSMVRFTAAGTPDPTFDLDGVFFQSLTTTFATDQIMNMAIQDDGKLLALAGWATDQRLARFHLGTQQFTLSSSDAIDVLDNETANQPPVAQVFQYGTFEDTPLNEFLRASDPNGDPLTYTIVTQPAQGSVQITNASIGTFTYTPPLNFNGTVSFMFKVNDGQVDSNVAPVFVTVSAVNDAPVAHNDAYSTDENVQLTVPAATGVLANDTNVEGGPLTSVLASGPANGTLTLNANGSFTYTPNANFNGTDSFTYRASDGNLVSNVATVILTVTPVNAAPVAQPDSYSATEDIPLTVPVAGVLANDSDVNNDSLTAVLVSGPSHGTVTLNGNGSFTYTPAPNFYGTDSFTYKANDGQLDSNVATVTITVSPVNDAPVAVGDSYSTTEDTPLTIQVPGVLGNDTDVDGDTLTAALVSGPAHGTLTLNSNGSFVYTPAAGFSGSDTFTYRASDGAAFSNVATVTITVSPKPATSGMVAGSGRLDGGARQFNISVQSREGAGGLNFAGQVSFEDRQLGISLASTSITYLRVEADGVHATIRGTATVNGVSGYTFTVYVEDNGTPGRNDWFRIVISGPQGFAYDSADFAILGGLLDSGNIRVRRS